MASTFFLMKQFEDVLLYLSSVKTYFPNDDAFNFNYAQVSMILMGTGEGLEYFLLATNVCLTGRRHAIKEHL